MEDFQEFTILPPEFVGFAAHGDDGILRIGTPRLDGSGVVEIRLTRGSKPGWWNQKIVNVFVRRFSDDLSIAEIQIAQHDALTEAELEHQFEQAEIYPLGPKEYWRSEFVGGAAKGTDGLFMTNEEFEEIWDVYADSSFREFFDDSTEDYDY
jgi:hypothetical protein